MRPIATLDNLWLFLAIGISLGVASKNTLKIFSIVTFLHVVAHRIY
jgi:hypothetical protein